MTRTVASVEERAVALVIDPDGSARQETAALLHASGYDVFLAGTGEDGLALAREHKPMVVAIEIELPGMDGWEATRQLRDQTDAYIVLMTSSSDEGDVIGGLHAGADTVVTKPLRPHEFRARVKALTRRMDAQRARARAERANTRTLSTMPAARHQQPSIGTGLSRQPFLGAPPIPASIPQVVPQPAPQPVPQPVMQPVMQPVEPAYVEQLWTRPAPAPTPAPAQAPVAAAPAPAAPAPAPVAAPSAPMQSGFSRAPQTPITTVAPWEPPAQPAPTPVPTPVAAPAPVPEREIEWSDFRGLSYEPIRRMVAVDGRPIQVEPREFDLLLEVLLHGGAVCRRDELAAILRSDSDTGPITAGERAQVDRIVGSLMAKLGEISQMPRWLEVIPSVGVRRVNA